MDERRGSVQLVISVASILSVIVASISILSFVQLAEKRLTTMEVRIEYLADTIRESKDILKRSR